MSNPEPQGIPYEQLGVRRPAVDHYDEGMRLLVEAGPMGYGAAKDNQLASAVAWFLAGLLKTQLDAAGAAGEPQGWG